MCGIQSDNKRLLEVVIRRGNLRDAIGGSQAFDCGGKITVYSGFGNGMDAIKRVVSRALLRCVAADQGAREKDEGKGECFHGVLGASVVCMFLTNAIGSLFPDDSGGKGDWRR